MRRIHMYRHASIRLPSTVLFIPQQERVHGAGVFYHCIVTTLILLVWPYCEVAIMHVQMHPWISQSFFQCTRWWWARVREPGEARLISCTLISKIASSPVCRSTCTQQVDLYAYSGSIIWCIQWTQQYLTIIILLLHIQCHVVVNPQYAAFTF